MRKMKPQAGIWLFIGLWTFIVGIFDIILIYSATRNIIATTYAQTEGVITSSEVERHTSRSGSGSNRQTTTTYSLEITYDYTVNGHTYTGDRYRFGQASSSDGSAYALAQQLPVGKRMPVFYSTWNPGTSLLKPGLGGDSLFMALFLTPFNIIMAGGWYFAMRGVRGKWGGRFLNPRRQSDGEHVKIGPNWPLAAAVGALLGLSFISIFIVGFWQGFNAPLGFMVGWWIGLLSIVVGIYCFVRAKQAGTSHDLVMDDAGTSITLPANYGRTEPVKLRRDAIESIDVSEVRGGAVRDKARRCHVVLTHHDASRSGAEVLARFPRKADAEQLAAALRDWVGLERNATMEVAS